MTQGYFDVDRVPFDGSPLLALSGSRRRRRDRYGRHGPDCSGNPEIGCVCGYDEHVNDHDGSRSGW